MRVQFWNDDVIDEQKSFGLCFAHTISLWISHNVVNGVTFWADHGTNVGRILHQRVEWLDDGADSAAIQIASNCLR